MPPPSHHRWHRQAIGVLTILLVIRLAAMSLIPLNDTTEARYAEIARKMLETGNWITLLHDYEIPFWAKPPLSTWLSALSMSVFGVNELAVRLPSLLLAVATVWLVASLVTDRRGRDAGMLAALVLSGSLLFYLSAGAVMTDPSLVFCTTLVQVSGWQALALRHKAWGYAFFVGLGLGLLAKGPIAIVLTVIPIGLWVLITHRWQALWQRLPWIPGTCLVLLIAAPWYLLSEYRTPGFLQYFIVGEHLGRFLEVGWTGDRYGYAHATVHGMVWLYAVAALLPWPFVMLWWLCRRNKKAEHASTEKRDGWISYLLLWVLMPLAFFTASGNIILPYVLPMMPGFAILYAELASRPPCIPRGLSLLALTSGIITVAIITLFIFAPGTLGHTQKAMISKWQAEKPTPDSQFLLWNRQREFSAEFYTHGRIRTSSDIGQILALLNSKSVDYLAVEQQDYSQLPSTVRTHFHEIGRFHNPNKVMLLLKKNLSLSTATHRASHER